ncbi:hypothetical protein HF086_007668 [Spodoptera exigua]|uniref:Uncharacterized protein n=1 Tax=Spodoptera exigua TaxID=7107 RepID=A0A922M6X8_SPOEX|nr:hypothetical protein HF086_007668 [Spodoptera exigua]
MPRCINCWIAIPITQQYLYNATDMDLEIISVLEDWIARQVIDEDYLCQECVNLLILETNNSERQFGHDSVCVCCGISIARRTGRRSHQLNYGDAEWIYTANIISPLEMPANARACNACWQRAHRQPPPAESGLFVISTARTDNEDNLQEPNPIISGSSSIVDSTMWSLPVLPAQTLKMFSESQL